MVATTPENNWRRTIDVVPSSYVQIFHHFSPDTLATLITVNRLCVHFVYACGRYGLHIVVIGAPGGLFGE